MDAAHGKGRCPARVVQWAHVVRVHSKEGRVDTAGSIGRRGMVEAPRADVRQASRRFVAVARSRRVKQSLWECGGGCEQWFCNECRCVCGSFEPCGPQPRRAEARKRAPQAAPESQVLLCHSERSEEICNNRVTDSSSIFRSPQNDNAAFALNHFGLETHSSARPGRLRGSRF